MRTAINFLSTLLRPTDKARTSRVWAENGPRIMFCVEQQGVALVECLCFALAEGVQEGLLPAVSDLLSTVLGLVRPDIVGAWMQLAMQKVASVDEPSKHAFCAALAADAQRTPQDTTRLILDFARRCRS